MDKELSILILEDRKADMELTRRAVLREFPNASFTHALNKEEFLKKLDWMAHDIVLADYHLPGYNGLEALLHLRATKPYLPFIFVTGMLDSEESAANAILHGANGYVLKANLKALPQQMKKALAWARAKIGQEENAQKELMARQLKIQKITGLLERSPDSPEKETMLKLLKEL